MVSSVIKMSVTLNTEPGTLPLENIMIFYVVIALNVKASRPVSATVFDAFTS